MNKHTEGRAVISFVDCNHLMVSVEDEKGVRQFVLFSQELSNEEEWEKGKEWNAEIRDNAERIAALWNAADGMSNEDAVKALANFEEMKGILEDFLIRLKDEDRLDKDFDVEPQNGATIERIKALLAKLEAQVKRKDNLIRRAYYWMVEKLQNGTPDDKDIISELYDSMREMETK